MFGIIRQVYIASLKPRDIPFNTYLARPLAAPLVLCFARLGIRPNHVTIWGSLPAFLGAYCFVSMPENLGLWLGILGFELAYLFDCVDGQLARYTNQVTQTGGRLDFAMDGVKALLMAAALSIRFQFESGLTSTSIYLGLGVVCALAIALSCTYGLRGRTIGRPGIDAPMGIHGPWYLGPFKWVAHYPSSLPVFAIFLPLESFLWAYGAVHVLYAGRSILVLANRIGRVSPDAHSGEEDEVR